MTVAVNGAVVTLTGVAKGDATVTVTASDGSLTAQQAFTVTVPNRAPEAVGTIAAQTVNKGSNVPVRRVGELPGPGHGQSRLLGQFIGYLQGECIGERGGGHADRCRQGRRDA